MAPPQAAAIRLELAIKTVELNQICISSGEKAHLEPSVGRKNIENQNSPATGLSGAAAPPTYVVVGCFAPVNL